MIEVNNISRLTYVPADARIVVNGEARDLSSATNTELLACFKHGDEWHAVQWGDRNGNHIEYASGRRHYKMLNAVEVQRILDAWDAAEARREA